MEDVKMFSTIGLGLPKVLLPRAEVDMTRWAVIACDQYTSQPNYWISLAESIGESPSTLHLILPEVYLETDKEDHIIQSVNQRMIQYTSDGTLRQALEGFVAIDRRTSHVLSRKGLVVALDLEHYDYNKGSTTLIRATEGTILSRLPPRMKVRAKAAVETPHIMVLIDDPDRTVIEPLFNANLPRLYDFDLLANGGHITGYAVSDPETIQKVGSALARLADPEVFSAKYRVTDQPVLLFAMGDGNHSLATAKAHWEKLKAEGAPQDHPARHALVELVNIHDEGLEFEPIHRIMFNVNVPEFLEHMKSSLADQEVEVRSFASVAEARNYAASSATQAVPMVWADDCAVVTFTKPKSNLAVGTLQTFLDNELKNIPSMKIDYVHGDEVVTELGTKPGNIGFFLPAIDKFAFFRTIILDGTLPRKTFSMGEADEKRFYVECRQIVP